MPRPTRRPSWKMLHRLGMIRNEQAEDRLVNPDQVMYAARLDGSLDLDRLARAWDLVQLRHPVIGSSFDLASDHWRIEEPVTAALTLSRLAPESRTEQRAAEELGTVLRAPFDLTRGPLARLHAIPIDDATTIVGMACDHIASDAWSAQILFAELWQLYLDPAAALPLIRVTFPDTVAEEHAWLASPAGQAAVERRIAMLDPIGPQPTASLPGQRHSDSSYAKVHRHRFTLAAADLARLRTIGALRGLTPSVLAHAALAGALHEFTGAQDVGTTLAVANRASRSLHRTQGWLADNVVVATRSDDVRKPAFIGHFAGALADALDYSQVSLGVLIRRMAPEQFGRPSPHPTAAFNPGATLDQRFPVPLPPGLTMTEVPLSYGWGYRTIVVHGAESEAGLGVRISVKDRWFEPTAAESLGHRMHDLLTVWAAAH
jgi:hypothetical protein